MVGHLRAVAEGEPLALCEDIVKCPGGRRYLGFSRQLMPNFEYFLSCGIPGKLEGERYKKSPELVEQTMDSMEEFEAPATYAVFKRWDILDESEQPEVVIFLAHGDVLSGLFTLSNFDEPDTRGVIAPFGAGCSTIVRSPYLEARKERPRSVLGMFDVSARPCVSKNRLSFATPMKKFCRMVDNMDESFLITDSWKAVRNRIEKEMSV